MAATLTLPFAPAEPWPALLDDLRASGFSLVALTPASDAREIADLAASPRSSRVALLLGHEGNGLSQEAVMRADYRVRIPMTPGADSLNVASAAAIALYEIAGLASESRIQNSESRIQKKALA
jgi:tRNA G18 (ribose-2'-O)-methylase SpoU